MILCDTNILIEFYKGRADVMETFSAVGVSKLAVSVVTVGELFGLIAATALHHSIPLYTLNVKDFRYISGLSIYS